MFKLSKRKILIILLIFSVRANSHSLILENSTLTEFTHFVADVSSRTIIVTTDLDTRFSINTEYQTNKQLLSYLKSSVKSLGLSYYDNDESIVISEYSGSELPDLQTVNYKFNKISSSRAYKVITELFNDNNRNNSANKKDNSVPTFRPLVVDSIGNNSLVITATDEQHRTIKTIIQSIDVAMKQVLIEAVISELSDSDFEGLDTRLQLSAGLNTVASGLTLFNPAAGFSLRLANSKSLKFFLDYLKTTDDSRILSQPRLMVIDREEAKINVGQNIPIITGTSTSAANDTDTPYQTIERVNIGLKLYVTPVITQDGLIEVKIYQESSSINEDTHASDVVTNLRSIDTRVIVKDGDTFLLGGLKSVASETGVSYSLPWISELPYIGALFRGKKEKNKIVNLVVLMTVKIISPESKDNQVNEAGLIRKHGFTFKNLIMGGKNVYE